MSRLRRAKSWLIWIMNLTTNVLKPGSSSPLSAVSHEQALPGELDLLVGGASVTVEALVVAGQRLLGAAQHVDADHLVVRADEQFGHVVVEIGGLVALEAEVRVRLEVVERVAEVVEADEVVEVAVQVADEARPHARQLLDQLHVVALGLELAEEVRLDRLEVESRCRRCSRCRLLGFFCLLIVFDLVVSVFGLSSHSPLPPSIIIFRN